MTYGHKPGRAEQLDLGPVRTDHWERHGALAGTPAGRQASRSKRLIETALPATMSIVVLIVTAFPSLVAGVLLHQLDSCCTFSLIISKNE
jgi:hypothetical protein